MRHRDATPRVPRVLLALLVVLALLSVPLGCSGDDESSTKGGSNQSGSTGTTATTGTTVEGPVAGAPVALPAALVAFSPFEDVPLLVDSPAYEGPATPTSLDGVARPPGIELSAAQQEALTTNGFVVVPSEFKQFQQVYDATTYNEGTVFVTTDAAYHAMHLAFSKVLREIEQNRLLPLLEDLVGGALEAARAQQAELEDTDVSEAADRVVQLFQVAGSLLGLDVGPLGRLAEEEAALALEAEQLTASPVTSFDVCNPGRAISNCVDYSLFEPRGHYTRNADLERYFRAMSMLGNSAFFVDDAESLRLGLLASRALASVPALLDAWRLIYEPTAFMVGAADDYTPGELADMADEAAPGWRDDPAALADETVVAAVGDALRARRTVAIDEEAASVRIMGARFVIDSYVYDRLRWPFVGTEEQRRVIASPLDVAGVMGSDAAQRLQEAAGETEYESYDEQFDALRGLFAQRELTEWAGTVYDAWLYALEPVWSAKGAAYPDLVQRDAWTAKDLQTGAGSYTELKHDTILYAKQSFAAEGDAADLGYEPRHWVEPNPVAFERMSAVLGLLRDGLTTRGLLEAGDAEAALLGATIDLVDRLGRLARDELAREPISEDDNLWLARIGPVLEAQWVQSSDIDPAIGAPAAQDSDAALVADIMRSTLEIVEVGTGRIDRIMVLVPDDEDRFQIAFGGVYSYYEFVRAAAEGRLTDEEWRAQLEGGDAPSRPAWQQQFLAG